MARVTVEDCVEKVPNRFELVMLAAKRSRGISNGQLITVEKDNDKNPVIALREIADQTVSLDDLREELIHGLQRLSEPEEPEEDSLNEDSLLARSRAEMEEAGGMLSAPAEATGADEGIEEDEAGFGDESEDPQADGSEDGAGERDGEAVEASEAGDGSPEEALQARFAEENVDEPEETEDAGEIEVGDWEESEDVSVDDEDEGLSAAG